jgi:hypothetical protein
MTSARLTVCLEIIHPGLPRIKSVAGQRRLRIERDRPLQGRTGFGRPAHFSIKEANQTVDIGSGPKLGRSHQPGKSLLPLPKALQSAAPGHLDVVVIRQDLLGVLQVGNGHAAAALLDELIDQIGVGACLGGGFDGGCGPKLRRFRPQLIALKAEDSEENQHDGASGITGDAPHPDTACDFTSDQNESYQRQVHPAFYKRIHDGNDG